MAYVVADDAGLHRIIIDFRDKPSIKQKALCWADIYAKINLNRDATPAIYFRQILSIPPGFGIRIWNLPQTLYHCIGNLFRCRFRPLGGIMRHITDYLYACLRREPINAYRDALPQPGYVFHASTLWEHDNCRRTTNRIRKFFMEYCRKEPSIMFEGGFLANSSHPDYESYRDSILPRAYPLAEYLAKTKRSCVVFNTPAVHQCHGWKLGEYLAMRKVIISTPLSNELPEDLVHGENILIIRNEMELDHVLQTLFADPELCRKVSHGADVYYEKQVRPLSVIARIDNKIDRYSQNGNKLEK